jgi:valyl-tRNA synthetase
MLFFALALPILSSAKITPSEPDVRTAISEAEIGHEGKYTSYLPSFEYILNQQDGSISLAHVVQWVLR